MHFILTFIFSTSLFRIWNYSQVSTQTLPYQSFILFIIIQSFSDYSSLHSLTHSPMLLLHFNDHGQPNFILYIVS